MGASLLMATQVEAGPLSWTAPQTPFHASPSRSLADDPFGAAAPVEGRGLTFDAFDALRGKEWSSFADRCAGRSLVCREDRMELGDLSYSEIAFRDVTTGQPLVQGVISKGPSPQPSAQVPEPSTLAVAGIGLGIALAEYARSRQRGIRP